MEIFAFVLERWGKRYGHKLFMSLRMISTSYLLIYYTKSNKYSRDNLKLIFVSSNSCELSIEPNVSFLYQVNKLEEYYAGADVALFNVQFYNLITDVHTNKSGTNVKKGTLICWQRISPAANDKMGLHSISMVIVIG